ncbi:FIST C-terminal domain-containing protein [Frigidibacter sp. RF13]|uniref:FIST N-terminal domain-containing protein n=1 Tax=Frigidibacter sp. RF13 TaxID=2997340 RepID=UPI00226E4F9C|nr:FIST N-terminal domain-containing protein [Frigidibacter sp. RF13]MCY1125995.1 FIST C-terminal domain-containing protein [Frigidibacter sp. RF13]
MSGAQTVLTSWAEAGDVLRVAVAPARPTEADGDPVEQIAATLAGSHLAAVFLFVSPEADAAAIARRASARFAPVPVIGCTTAGEISPDGYVEGQILAIGLPAGLFAVETRLVPDLDDLVGERLISDMIRARQALTRARPDWEGEFAFVMVDGLSRREDELTAALAAALGPVPLFGGSAGDGLRFGNTFVFHQGHALQKAAVITFVRSRCRVKVFNLDHLVPTDQRMVVTGADPARRIVHTINAEPAAFEYARLLGKDPTQLTTFTFAAHPVVVRFGGRHHVRSIQRMEANGDLHFFSAIGEGLVLTLAEPQDMADHLAHELDALGQREPPAAILACDCVLRRIEAQEKQAFGRLSDLLRRHRVVGFSTYGEQLGAMHVNQTMTGVAIYPPEEGAP